MSVIATIILLILTCEDYGSILGYQIMELNQWFVNENQPLLPCCVWRVTRVRQFVMVFEARKYAGEQVQA